MTLLSLLICCYNGESFIDKCISSIRASYFKEFEVIFIDDGSTDDTSLIFQSLTRDDHRFTYHRISHSGLTAALNYGVYKCNTDLIVRLDVDDLITPFRLSDVHNFFQNHPHKDFYVGAPIFLSSSYVYLRLYSPFFILFPLISKLSFCFFNPFAHSCISFRRSFLIRNAINYGELNNKYKNSFHTTLPFFGPSQDYLLTSQASLLSNISITNTPHAIILQHDSSISAIDRISQNSNLLALSRVNRKLFFRGALLCIPNVLIPFLRKLLIISSFHYVHFK
jgi:glycosyltransferase involved in cell wall biosynthesis